jgi:hypothetical protein
MPTAPLNSGVRGH